MSNSISLIAILSLFTLLPFIIASGTCFIKFSIVFVIVRNALGLQQVPSNMTLKEGANKQVISSQADSLIKISRIWADFFPANTSNQPI